MLSIGIVGLPNVGKSTLFQALTRIAVPIAPYPFTTIEPHQGVVAVPDERLEKLAELIKPEKVVPATIEFVDIAGLVKGAAEGQGLGNQFLSHIYSVDAILFLLRAFHDPNVPASAAEPQEELEILREELRKKDEEVLKQSPNSPRLSTKPAIVVCNIRNGANGHSQILKNLRIRQPECQLALDCKLELEMTEMRAEELKELGLQSKLGGLIKKAYEVLGLITFYTIKGGKELHAWPIKRGTFAPAAGGQVHSDFEQKFIRAEVISFEKLIEVPRSLRDLDPGPSGLGTGSWHQARELGWIRTEGREYVVHDGDVIEFRI